MHYLILILGMIMSYANAEKHLAWKLDHYSEAKSAPTHFRFVGESTKFGFVTTSFDGFALEGEINYVQTNLLLKDVELKLVSRQIDTDNGSRNEKLWEKCLRVSIYPFILVSLKEPIDLEKDVQDLNGTMKVGDTSISLDIHIKKLGPNVFSGSSSFGLKAAGIPDPSIAIAKVKDKMDIQFKVTLP